MHYLQFIRKMDNYKPTRCINPILKFCQECKYGWVIYPEWVETHEDLEGCCFESGCMYGLEKDEPTEDELKAFEEWYGGKK